MAEISLRIHCVVSGLVFAIFPTTGYYLKAFEEHFVWDYPNHTTKNTDYENMIIVFLAVQAIFLWIVAARPLVEGKRFLQFFIVSTAAQSFLRMGMAADIKQAHLSMHGDIWQLFFTFLLTAVFYVNYFWPNLL